MWKQSYLKWKAIDSIWGKILLQSCEYLKTDQNRYESFVKQRPRRKIAVNAPWSFYFVLFSSWSRSGPGFVLLLSELVSTLFLSCSSRQQSDKYLWGASWSNCFWNLAEKATRLERNVKFYLLPLRKFKWVWIQILKVALSF